MEVPWLLLAHGSVTAVVVVSFLCGQWPIFEGTFVQRINHFLTVGAYDFFLRFVLAVCGSRTRDSVLAVEHYCCDRPNPILQVLYVAIVGTTYFIIVQTSFKYIPGYYVGELHRYLSIVAVFVGTILFVLTSFSDPGTITNENVSHYLSAYPYDNVIYVEKECSTCKFTRPARAKHCRICDKCVARFDHHCGWMNNCIGEKNTRYFVAFLIWHFLICVYGAIILGFILAGELKERKVIYILTGQSWPSPASPCVFDTTSDASTHRRLWRSPLEMPKPSQSVLNEFLFNRCHSKSITYSLVSNSVASCMSTGPPQHAHLYQYMD